MSNQEIFRLSNSLETDVQIIRLILDQQGDDFWSEACQEAWENGDVDTSYLTPGVYCFGCETLKVA